MALRTVTFTRPESYTQGWKGKTTRIDVLLDKVVVGEVVGRENASFAGVMMWHYELRDKRREDCDSMRDAKAKVRALLEVAPLPEY
jgi:hypothetical protein